MLLIVTWMQIGRESPMTTDVYGPEWQDVRRNKRLRNCTGENVSSNTTYEAAYNVSKDDL